MKLKATLQGHTSGIYKLVAEDDILFSASGDGILAGWDLKTFQPSPFSVKVGLPVYSVAVQDARMLIGQGHGGIHVIDRESKKEIRHLKFHEKGVFDICYNPLQNHFYSTGGGGSLSVFDGDNYNLLLQIPLSGGKLRRLLLSPDSKHLFVTASDGNIHVLDTGYFNQLQTIHGHDGGTYSLAWVGQNKLATGGRDAHLRFWDFTGNQLTETANIPAHNYAIYDILVLSSGTFATASRDRNVKIWNVDDLQNPSRIKSDRSTTHGNSVNTLCKTDNYLISAGDDRLIRIWETGLTQFHNSKSAT